jgi:hypothetical protein
MTTRQSKARAAASPTLRGVRRVFVVACALLGVSCITPTLPPDDPPLPRAELLADDAVLLSGLVSHSPASVFARNRATGLIFGQTTPDGFYSFEVKAAPCDALDFWYRSGTFQSSPLRFAPAELTEPPLARGVCSAAAPETSVNGDDPPTPSLDAGSDAAP